MNRSLWAPWRMAYIRSLESQAAQAAAGAPPLPEEGNFIATCFRDPAQDEANHVVHRAEGGLILLNRYPYANGHLLVALGEPRPTLGEYSAAQRAAFWRLVDTATDLVERTLRPQGINIGVNVGRAAGAGLPQHVHAHVVPRWAGDTNFLSVIGEVRVIPESLATVAATLRNAAAALPGRG